MTHASSLRLLVLHALRLKGVAEPELIAETMATDLAATKAELGELERLELVTYRHGRMSGYTQTPEGRSHAEWLLQEELDRLGIRPDIERTYDDFRGCNEALLEICTAWQLRDVDGEPQPNDHTDVAYDAAVRARLVDLHEQADSVLDALTSCLVRFDGHRRRLRTALEHVVSGDHDYFTKPMFPSYHSIWFELHEDLLATLGTERSAEGNR